MTVFDSGPCDWLGLPLLLPTPTTQFSLDHKRRSRKRIRKKWKRSDSSDPDSVELMTPLTTPLFDFHWVISSLITPIPIPTPSLVKTSLYAFEHVRIELEEAIIVGQTDFDEDSPSTDN